MNKLNVLMVVGLVLGMVASSVLLVNEPKLKVNNVADVVSGVVEDTASWHVLVTYVNVGGKMFMKSKDGSLIPLGAEATVAAAGFLSIYFVNHSATASTLYTRNASAANFENWSKNVAGGTGSGAGYAYSNADNFNIQLKANTAFDIIVRCKFVRTAGPWNGTRWIGTNVRVNMTITGDITMTNLIGGWAESYNSSSSQSYYGNAYWCSAAGAGGAGTGMQIHPGTTITITTIVISAKS